MLPVIFGGFQMKSKAGWILLLVIGLSVVSGCTLRRHPIENPIITDSQQPDKELFDRAVDDLEHSRYTVARLTFQTLINTYPDSEFLAKAKLGIADSWYRQGGTSNLLQAEAEYRDFITFFPTMPEAGEAQMRVAMIHYRAMEKPDRDPTRALRAEQEFQKLMLTYPDGPFGPIATQRLREVQEVLAQGAFDVCRFYFLQGADRAAQPRLEELVERYPSFSRTDQALYLLGSSLERSGGETAAEAPPHYSRIVRDYPLSPRVKDAKERLTALEAPIPEPDPAAVARMTYENTHAGSIGLWGKLMGAFQRHPNVSAAQGKTGPPTMTAQGPAQPEVAAAARSSSSSGSTTAIFLEPVGTEGSAGNPDDAP